MICLSLPGELQWKDGKKKCKYNNCPLKNKQITLWKGRNKNLHQVLKAANRVKKSKHNKSL
jgi:hypothetical protein